MTAVSDRSDASVEPDEVPDRPSGRVLRLVLVAVIVLAVAAGGTALGWHLGRSGRIATPSTTSVDAGFARDMSVHHQQAITMAIYERANSTNPDLRLLAYDIEDVQTFQEGEMQGWLNTWSLTATSSRPQMAWMAGHAHLAADGLMPGMATPSQMDELQKAHGKALDILFLQLMIHHHQGGITMAQYAAQHAKEAYVRAIAQNMYVIQNDEIVQMEQTLRSLGGTPLPPP